MQTLSLVLSIIFILSFAYRYVYILIRIFTKKRKHKTGKLNRYAVLIAARNEEVVIGQLIDSIHKQDYPSDLVDIYLVADNCTDNTAKVAAEHGAKVFERFNKVQVGKGYALQFLTEQIKKEKPFLYYDGFLVFDADNLLHPAFISRINDVFDEGYAAVLGYRAAKNFDDTWITGCYGIYFLYESECANRPRDFLGTSCMLNGTGHVIASRLIDEWGGWKWTSLTEDLECTSYLISQGERIAFCPDAVLYDEQPLTLGDSIKQRTRWVKGYIIAIKTRFKELFHAMFKKGGFAAYDFLMNLLPVVIVVISFIVDIIECIVITMNGGDAGFIVNKLLLSIPGTFIVLYILGIIPLILAWKSIRCSAGKKILYSFGFTLFMYSYMVVYVVALFAKQEWKPMKHKAAKNIEDIMGGDKKKP